MTARWSPRPQGSPGAPASPRGTLGVRKPSLPVLSPADHRPPARGWEAPAHSRRAAEGSGPLPALEEGSVRREAGVPRGIRSGGRLGQEGRVAPGAGRGGRGGDSASGPRGAGAAEVGSRREAVGTGCFRRLAYMPRMHTSVPAPHARDPMCTPVLACTHPYSCAHTREPPPHYPPRRPMPAPAHPCQLPHTPVTPRTHCPPRTPVPAPAHPCPPPHTRDHAHTARRAGLCPPRTPLTPRTHCPPRMPVPHPTHLYPHTALRPTG